MLPEIVKTAAIDFKDKTALDCEGTISVSYEELDRISDEMSGALLERGLVEGSLILLSLPTSIEYLIAYIAASKIGVITAGINPRLKAPERESICEIAEPNLVITTIELSYGISPEIPVEIIEIAENKEKLLTELRLNSFQPKKLNDNLDRPVCVCFTSGSTGTPKGALFTNKQLLAIQKMDTEGVWGSGGHLVPSTAFAHVGSMTKLPWQLSQGVTLHILDRWKAKSVLQLVEKHRISAIAGVSAQIALLLKVDGFEDYDLSCVKAIVAGGGPSPPSLVLRAQENFNAPYSIRYSSTESGGIGLATSLEASEEESLYTIGKPRTGVQAKILDEEGQLVETGEIGELFLRTPSSMHSYWNDAENTKKSLVDGWLKTEDLAKIDDRGFFRLTGRTNEMFIRGGYNVYPQEVESVLSTHPKIEQMLLIPRPHPTLGEIGVAFVVLKHSEENLILDDLIEFGKNKLAKYKLPEEINIIDEIPLKNGFKIDRFLLKNLFLKENS
jgi:acyl-CoA synthetase (AMP-forming)/AMP-acid ligase II